MHITDWFSGLAAVVAVVISVIALVYARWSARSASASADAAKRSAAVAERGEQRQLEDTERRAVRWEVERLGNAGIKLWNTGDDTAYDVWAEPSEDVRFIGGPPPVEGRDIPRSTGVSIGALDYGQASGHLVIRRRTRPDGPEKHMTYPL